MKFSVKIPITYAHLVYTLFCPSVCQSNFKRMVSWFPLHIFSFFSFLCQLNKFSITRFVSLSIPWFIVLRYLWMLWSLFIYVLPHTKPPVSLQFQGSFISPKLKYLTLFANKEINNVVDSNFKLHFFSLENLFWHLE